MNASLPPDIIALPCYLCTTPAECEVNFCANGFTQRFARRTPTPSPATSAVEDPEKSIPARSPEGKPE